MSEVGRRFHKEDRRYTRGRGPEFVVVLDGVGCRAAERTVLACYVDGGKRGGGRRPRFVVGELTMDGRQPTRIHESEGRMGPRMSPRDVGSRRRVGAINA
jgi:hypothetical protein